MKEASNAAGQTVSSSIPDKAAVYCIIDSKSNLKHLGSQAAKYLLNSALLISFAGQLFQGSYSSWAASA